MDVQKSVVSRYGDSSAYYLGRLGKAMQAARKAGIGIIYVIVSFRAGYPEISPRNQTFSALKAGGHFVDDTVYPAVAPQPGEVIVTKKRVSAFAGSDLEVILRARGIDHLVLTGIATSGVVLSTVRQAADLDYRVTVLADGCLDGDSEVHTVLTQKVFPRQATVIDCDAFIRTLG
jgi:nicotinamidase-related amidase